MIPFLVYSVYIDFQLYEIISAYPTATDILLRIFLTPNNLTYSVNTSFQLFSIILPYITGGKWGSTAYDFNLQSVYSNF